MRKLMIYCNTKYINGYVEILAGRYSNNRLALSLGDPNTGELWTVATVNIPDEVLGDEIILKNWSENEGILDFFIQNGLSENTGREIHIGYVVANVVKITKKLKDIIEI